MSGFEDVGEFHRKMGLPTSDRDQHGPHQWDDELLEFRIRFLREELDEFIEGVEETDHAKMFDALLDLVYVAFGTAHLLGYPWEDGWNAVQAANIAKRRAQTADESKRGSALDVVKPEGWQPPDIEGLLRRHGWG
jgi:predicted HAD superfamily Cof-like phosphohydrolase